MKKKFYETEEFKRLNKEWQKKLEESGFEDIEKSDNDFIRQHQVFTADKVQSEGGREYYLLCQKILREYDFKDNLHRLIFELHTEGKSVREISTFLQLNSERTLKKSVISDVINKIKNTFISKPEPTEDEEEFLTVEYNRFKLEILENHNFETPEHKFIFELHCLGNSARQIGYQCSPERTEEEVEQIIKKIKADYRRVV